VARNRAKRRLRAAFAKCAPASGYDVVVIADERVNSSAFGKIVDDLRIAMRAAGVR
jgi:ribonuclease P protein component